MYPAPPQLFHGVGVTDDDAWESYWKVENGIRLTGCRLQGPIDGNADLAGGRAGKKRGQNFRVREERACGGRLDSYVDGDATEQPAPAPVKKK